MYRIMFLLIYFATSVTFAVCCVPTCMHHIVYAENFSVHTYMHLVWSCCLSVCLSNYAVVTTQLVQTSVRVFEGRGVVEVCVEKDIETVTTVTVNITTSPGLAQGGYAHVYGHT